MCTVSFLPLARGAYLLGTNRDESPLRGRASPPEVSRGTTRNLIMPRDSDAGGTWVTVDDHGRCLCILNGDRPAVAPPAEAPSRGTLLLELAERLTPAEMLHVLQERHAARSLTQKAFKLLVVDPGEENMSAVAVLIEWNGRDAPFSRTLRGPFVLVSSSFDPEGVAAHRERAFVSLAAMSTEDPEALADAQSLWHASHSADEPSGGTRSVCMHREEASTVSYTAVCVDKHRVTMRYQPGLPCEGQSSVRVSLDVTG